MVCILKRLCKCLDRHYTLGVILCFVLCITVSYSLEEHINRCNLALWNSFKLRSYDKCAVCFCTNLHITRTSTNRTSICTLLAANPTPIFEAHLVEKTLQGAKQTNLGAATYHIVTLVGCSNLTLAVCIGICSK